MSRFHFRTTERTRGFKLTHMFSCCVWATADSGSRIRSSSKRARADAKTAVGGCGSFGNDAHQLSIGLLREGASAGFAQVGTHTNSCAMCHKRGTKTVFEARSGFFRELDRPFETAPKTTRESTSTNSRLACTPSRRTRLRRLTKLSSSMRLMYFPLENPHENIVVQFNFKASGAAAARPSCMLLGGSWCFSPKREGECPPSQEALQERPIYTRSREHRDEHERNSAFKKGIRVCLKRHPGVLHTTLPRVYLPDLPAFVGIWRTSCQASGRCTSMCKESTCTSENCKALRMTRSPMYTTPFVFVRGKGSPLISRDRSFRARARRKCLR